MSGTDKPENASNRFPVQPTFLAVRELHFVSHRPPSKDDKIDQNNIKVSASTTEFSEQTKRIQITLRAEYGFEASQAVSTSPYSVKVSITGEFVIDDSFPRDKIGLWAQVNAPFIIFPYIRERLYYLTNQGGYPPLLLPLLLIPTFKIVQEKAELQELK